MKVICVWNCRFYKRAQSNDPLNVSLWFWVVKFIIWMLVLEILLNKKSLIVLVTTLSLALFHLRIFAYRLSQFSLPSFFYRFIKYYKHSCRQHCIFFHNSLFSSKDCLWPECQMGVHTQFTYKQRARESFHGVTLACIGLLRGRVYINLI